MPLMAPAKVVCAVRCRLESSGKLHGLRPILLPTFFFAGQIRKVIDTGRVNTAQVCTHERRNWVRRGARDRHTVKRVQKIPLCALVPDALSRYPSLMQVMVLTEFRVLVTWLSCQLGIMSGKHAHVIMTTALYGG